MAVSKARTRRDDDTMPASLKKGKNLFCYVMISLAVFHFIVFYVCINFDSVLLAFKEFVGIENGKEMYRWSLNNFVTLWKDITGPNSTIGEALGNTALFFSLSVVLIPLCFFISYFLYKNIWGYRVFKVIFFLPSIISSVVLVTMVKNFIAADGPLSIVIQHFGGESLPSLLTNDKTAKWVIFAYCAWTGFGVNVVLYQGAMGRIPDSVIEAGVLDGVSAGREMFSIILPMMWPTLSTTIILMFTSVFLASGPNLLFIPEDGDQFGTMTLSYWIYHSVSSASYEYPSAVGLVFTCLGLPIVFGVRALANRLFEDVEY
ncbi:MAG: hypothetical protein DBX59_10755 [Bacillota bacterium]|nr:MAG: hypothetical protein DBX59_10755 [Bacillota bacterium]